MGDDTIQRRKADHLRVVAQEDVLHAGGTLLDCVQLLPDSLPELSLDEIDTTSQFFGKPLSLPLMITSMTGGEERGAELNRALARAAARAGIVFAVGSQRVMLRHPERAADFAVREQIPAGVLLANIGGQQLREYPVEDIAGLVQAIEADGICVHLNPAHELAQPEGERDFRGILPAIERLCEALPDKVVVKEVGHGIDPDSVGALVQAGVYAIDVAGAGGTSWTRVEAKRAQDGADANTGMVFGDWGIPTAVALMYARHTEPGAALIASGGIRNGLEAAAALAIGADIVGMAREVLLAFERGGEQGAERFIAQVAHELRCALLLTGCRKLSELEFTGRVYTGKLIDWLDGLRIPRPQSE